MYTGDEEYVQTYYQVIINVLDNFYPSVTDPATQLITKGLGVSGGYGDYAFLPRTGAVTYYNTLYVLALDNAASIAQYLGQHGDYERWSSRARNVSAAINTYRFDSRVGAFFDGDCGASPCLTHAQDGNGLSIVAGVANGTRAESVLEYLSTHMARFYGNAFYDNDLLGEGFSQRVYAFISYFELEARFITGNADSALEEIRRLYGWMANNDPKITMWEGIAENGTKYEGSYTSLAHGWATGIVPALSNYVLGVIPTGPGFSTWSIKPVPGDVQWAKGQVPTPNGPINVYWQRNEQFGLFYLTASTPQGGKGAISVPVGNASVAVWVDAEQAWDGHSSLNFGAAYEPDGYVSVNVGGGEHTIAVGSWNGGA